MTALPGEGAPSVAVLMATYNGAATLREQLNSLAAQTLAPSLVILSDDGSDDGSPEIARTFGAQHPALGITIVRGPCAGADRNFLSLMRACPDSTDFVALSDQDDVWLPEKIAVAVARLQERPGDHPKLYCSRTLEVDEDLRNPRLSRGAPLPAGFRHALVQNIAGGNTMVLNSAGADLLRAAAAVTSDVVVHDWWVYLVLSACGGEVIFDPVPHILYRQHGGNLIGANRGLRAKTLRLRMVLSGRFRAWCSCNIAALRQIEARLTPENRALLDAFESGRDQGLFGRLAMIRRCGLYRQGLAAQMSLYLAALLRRL